MRSRIRKNDFVVVTTGKDAGKKGRVIKVFPKEGRALVEGINFVKKHSRPRQVDRRGGIIQKEMPVSIANLMLFCLKCEKGVRIGMRVTDSGQRIRICRSCGSEIEVT